MNVLVEEFGKIGVMSASDTSISRSTSDVIRTPFLSIPPCCLSRVGFIVCLSVWGGGVLPSCSESTVCPTISLPPFCGWRLALLLRLVSGDETWGIGEEGRESLEGPCAAGAGARVCLRQASEEKLPAKAPRWLKGSFLEGRSRSHSSS